MACDYLKELNDGVEGEFLDEVGTTLLKHFETKYKCLTRCSRSALLYS